MFADEKPETIECNDDIRGILSPFVTAKFFMPINKKSKPRTLAELQMFSNVRKAYDEKFKEITDIMCRAIFERIALSPNLSLHK